ncbi:MAG TPA: ankyrin repeat domain-containing protein [Candidatus Saccharimonadales bacterium]|nr:ankyrin repeat domain-containing protein [Candidatus Saccharimonadales bacterium]
MKKIIIIVVFQMLVINSNLICSATQSSTQTPLQAREAKSTLQKTVSFTSAQPQVTDIDYAQAGELYQGLPSPKHGGRSKPLAGDEQLRSLIQNPDQAESSSEMSQIRDRLKNMEFKRTYLSHASSRSPDQGDSILQTAIKRLDYNTFMSLLNNPIGPIGLFYNYKNRIGNTALHTATEKNLPQYITDLLQRGADVQAENSEGETPLLMAIKYDFKESLRAILSDTLYKYEFMRDQRDKDGNIPLHYAAQHTSDKKIIDILLDKGFDPHTINKRKETPMIVATQYDNLPIVQSLVEHKVNMEQPNHNGFTPLLLATSLNYNDIAYFLIEAGARVNAQNIWGQTSLMRAIKNNNLGLVKFLLEHGADTELKDDDKNTALLIAAYLGNTDAVNLLIKAGAHTHVKNKWHQTYKDLMAAKTAEHFLHKHLPLQNY